jgi:hypothetical protein
MHTWKEIKGWKKEAFSRYGLDWWRYAAPDGKSVIEAAQSATVDVGASIGYGASIGDRASIGYGASIGNRASIGYWASIGYQASIGDGASIGYQASIGDGASIGYGASIGKSEQWVSIGPLGSDGRTLTIVSGKQGVRCYTGCFAGTDAEFLAAVKSKHGDGPNGVAYRAALRFAKATFARKEG